MGRKGKEAISFKTCTPGRGCKEIGDFTGSEKLMGSEQFKLHLGNPTLESETGEMSPLS